VYVAPNGALGNSWGLESYKHRAPCILPLSLFAILSLPWVAPKAEGGRVACQLLRPLSLVRRSALFLHACSPEDGRYLMASRIEMSLHVQG